MEVFLTTANQIAFLFLLIAVGFGLTKAGLIKSDASNALGKIENIFESNVYVRCDRNFAWDVTGSDAPFCKQNNFCFGRLHVTTCHATDWNCSGRCGI